MALTASVYAPDADEQAIADLSHELVHATGSAVILRSCHGLGPHPAAWNGELVQLISGFDVSHYWMAVKVVMAGAALGIGKKAGEKLADKALDKLVSAVITSFASWAGRHKREGKMAKLKLYGPSGELLKEIDV